jgi:aminoglycoside phosphotransferase (APT) family kinase protein
MTKPDTAEIGVEETKELARRLIEHHFGKKPRRLVHLPSGLSNFVFLAYHAEGDFVVRISPESTRIQDFIKEQWAISKAREAGVPTPEILEVGNHIIPMPYMVSKNVVGQEATFHPNRLQIIREMGHYAALINSISTTGFGYTFDWSSNQLSRNETWKDFLYKELHIEERLQILEKRRMLTPQAFKKFSAIVKKMARWTPKPSLNHGDIRLKNVIVNEEGKINAIIDWEDCLSNAAPHWELSLALHDLSIDEKHELLQGYDLKPKVITEMSPFIKALNLLNYAPKIDRLATRKDTAGLEQYRTRMRGALDLYSL